MRPTSLGESRGARPFGNNNLTERHYLTFTYFCPGLRHKVPDQFLNYPYNFLSQCK